MKNSMSSGCSVQFSRSVVSNSLWPHELQHTRPPCPSGCYTYITVSTKSIQKYLCCCCSVAKSCPTLCNPIDCSTWGFRILHHLPELAQAHVRWVSDAIQPSHPLLSPSPPALNLSQHQGLFPTVSSSYQVPKETSLDTKNAKDLGLHCNFG